MSEDRQENSHSVATSALRATRPTFPVLDDPRTAETELGFGALVGKSKPMRALYEVMHQAGSSSASVLIVGESGTGKELVARTLHHLSRRSGPFVAVNCAAIPETLLEGELFGHEKGAFTGAHARRVGCFELAQKGTLFLDEISAMPVSSQVKLLRALEQRSFRRLRGEEEVQVDVRIITAMNVSPQIALSEGKLRSDLYYRINVFTLHVPPLRDRISDLSLLARHFICALSESNGKTVVDLEPEALQALKCYGWPGNVRELRNVMERAVILANGDRIRVEDLPPSIGGSRPEAGDGSSPEDDAVLSERKDGVVRVGMTIEQVTQHLILKTLEATGNNKTRAARLLGISTKTIYNKLNEWGSDSWAEAG